MSDKHLSSQFDAELSAISTRVLEMGGLVESQVVRAVHALTNFSGEIAGEVLKDEERVNAMEVEIDRDLSAIIARRQPTARDLRLRLIECLVRLRDLRQQILGLGIGGDAVDAHGLIPQTVWSRVS